MLHRYSKYSLVAAVIVMALFCNAQNNNLWYFGNGGGVNFNHSPPTSLLNKISTSEGCSSVADDNGNLLFYTDGITVWNKHHIVMKNGKGLVGNTSTTQSSVVVRHPGDDSLYYIFNPDLFHTQASKGIFYSIIDMREDGGLGDVISKNIKLFGEKSAEKIAVVKASSLCGFWIITHEANSNKFNTFFLGLNGLDHNPVVSSVGFNYADNSISAVGYLTASPDGNKLAAALFSSIGIEVYDFDKQTGKVSNAYFLENSPNKTYYGVSFSPNSKYLYYADLYGRAIFQHDVSLSTVDSIRNSRWRLIQRLPDDVGALQLAPDGKIYAVYFDKDFLGSIDNPNEHPDSLRFTIKSVVISGNGVLGLPSFTNSNNFAFTPKLTLGNDTTVCANSYTISTNKPLEKHLWSNGDTTPTITVSKNGVYWATVSEKCITQTDSMNLIAIPDTLPQLNLGKDTSTCDTMFTIEASALPDVKYKWSTGDTTPKTTIKKGGEYTLTISNYCYLRRDTIGISFKYDTLGSIKIGNDTLICSESFTFSMPKIKDAKYLWSTGDKTRELDVSKSKLYWGRLTAPICNTHYYDTIKIEVYPTPLLSIGKDIEGCKKDFINKELTSTAKYINYLWSDGSTAPTFTIKESGLYTLSVVDTCGNTQTKSISVDLCDCFPYVPTSFTPNNDGKNDYFSITNTCELAFFDLKIFTRWGELIFQSKDPQTSWAGLYKGKAVPTGTYFVNLRYAYKASKTRNADYKGFIQLLR